MLNIVLPEKYKQIINITSHPKNIIVLIEMLLEEYTYNHKEDLKYLRKEVTRLEKENKNYKEQKQAITELENRYKIFDKFGQNIVTKEEIFNLYKLKLSSLIRLILQTNTSEYILIINECNEIEKEIYQNIIIEKIQDIQNRNAKALKNLKEEQTEAIRYITTLLKNKDNVYDFESILYDKFKIALLISCEQENGLQEFFDNFMVNKTDYKFLDIYENFFEFDDYIPLSTVCRLSYGYDLWRGLYSLVHKEENDYIFKVPEGIKGFFKSENKNQYNEFKNFFNSEYNKKICQLKKFINKQIDGKTVILKYLKKWNSSYPHLLIFNIDKLVINNELKEIPEYFLQHMMINKIIIPPNLIIKTAGFAGFSNIKVIEFKDYKNSKILNNYNMLKALLSRVFEVPFKSNKNGKLIYSKNIIMRQEKLIFSSESGKIIIKKEDVNFEPKDRSALAYSYPSEEIIKYFQKLLTEKEEELKAKKLIK